MDGSARSQAAPEHPSSNAAAASHNPALLPDFIETLFIESQGCADVSGSKIRPSPMCDSGRVCRLTAKSPMDA